MTAFTKTVTESLATSDSAVRSQGRQRLISDFTPVSDTPQRQFHVVRPQTQTLTTSDAVVRRTTTPRQITESLSSSIDALTSHLGAKRINVDNIGSSFSESVTRIYHTARFAVETTSLSDSPARHASLKRINTQTLVTSDTQTRHPTFVRINAQTLSTSESLLRRIQFARPNAETWSTTEAPTHVASDKRTVQETLALTSAASRLVIFGRKPAETLHTSDLVGHRGGESRNIADTLATIVNVLIQRQGHPRSVAETNLHILDIPSIQLLLPVMGYIITDNQNNVTGANLPDWGYLLVEDPSAGNMLFRQPVPDRQVTPGRTK